jgi:hypothetical protein
MPSKQRRVKLEATVSFYRATLNCACGYLDFPLQPDIKKTLQSCDFVMKDEPKVISIIHCIFVILQTLRDSHVKMLRDINKFTNHNC